MTIAVDFDGTIVEHRYPKIGEEIPFATETLKILAQERHKLILWTVREGELLEEAIEWCRQRGVFFYSVNKDYPEEEKSHNGFSRKLKADLFIDDRNRELHLAICQDYSTDKMTLHLTGKNPDNLKEASGLYARLMNLLIGSLKETREL